MFTIYNGGKKFTIPTGYKSKNPREVKNKDKNLKTTSCRKGKVCVLFVIKNVVAPTQPDTETEKNFVYDD